MSLDWNTSKIADRVAVTCDADGRMTAETEALIFACMVVGMNEITAANAEAFFKRLDKAQRAIDGLLAYLENGERVPVFFTLDDVLRHVGLWTNASRLTERVFAKRLAAAVAEHAARTA